MIADSLRGFMSRVLGRVQSSGEQFASHDEVEAAERSLYKLLLKPGHIVFDVGANVGNMTELFAKAVGPQGKVVAFEPARASFLELKERCSLLFFTELELVNAAVTDSEGSIELHVYDDDHRSWSSMVRRPLENYGIHIASPSIETVPAVSIDGYCRSRGIDHIDLMKIDVEGAELLVLRGARGMFQRKRIGLVIFEFGQTTFDMGFSPTDLIQLLDEVGYSVRNVVDGEPVFPGGTSAETARYSMHIAAPKE